MAPQTIECPHCGTTMEHVMGPRPNVPVHTYGHTCTRQVEGRQGFPGSIWPQRVGQFCLRSVAVEGAVA
jgi:hypothetical protein